jgi:hypothetical protein
MNDKSIGFFSSQVDVSSDGYKVLLHRNVTSQNNNICIEALLQKVGLLPIPAAHVEPV